MFRFKVVVDEDKKLLGNVDGIRTGERNETEREPLIPLIPTDLKEELWLIDTSDEAVGPRVLVNKRLPNASGLLTRDPVVRGLIMPQIVPSACGSRHDRATIRALGGELDQFRGYAAQLQHQPAQARY